MAVVTWDGSSSTDWNTAANWDTNAVPTSSDDVIIPDTSSINNCELSATGGNPKNVHSLKLEANGTLVGNDIAIRVYGEGDGSSGTTNGYAVDLDGIVSGLLHLTIQTDDTTNLDIIPSSGNVHDLTINLGDAARIAKIQTGGPTLTGDLTITSGQLSTENNALTVTGSTTIGPNSGAADQATLTCNASTCSFGAAVTSGYALDVKRGGTFNGGSGTHTSGAVKVTTDSNADAKLDFTSGTHVISSEYTSEDRFFELTTGTVTHSNGTILLNAAVTSAIQWTTTTGDNGPYNLTLSHASNTTKPRNALTILNNLTITSGTFNTQYDGSDKDLTVTGHCSVGTAGTLTCNTSTCQFGSLQVTNSGSATMNFSSGTTTIDCSTAGDGTWATQFGSSATINFNNGIIKFAKTDSGTRYLNFSQTHPLNNVIVDTNYDIPFAGQFNTTGYLDIQDGTLKSYGGSSDMAISGDLTVGNGTDAARLEYTSDANGFHNQSFGSVTVNANGTFDASNRITTINGGFHNNGTFNDNGGKIEMGGTGSVVNELVPNLNINNEAVYGNFNATTSSLTSAAGGFDNIWQYDGGCFAAWVYPKGVGEGSYGRLFQKGANYCHIGSLSGGFVNISFGIDHSTTAGAWTTTNNVLPVDSWSHVAIVYDSDSTSNNPVIYVNGVSVAVTEGTTPAGSYNSDASSDLYIGNKSDGSKTWDGYLMDIKIYKNVAITATNVAKMASKINVDKDAPDMADSTKLFGWYKFTSDATTDSSGNNHTLTASNMGSVVYDAFTSTLLPTMTEVDSLEVSSGVLDLDNRNYVDFDGSADYITIADAASLDPTDGYLTLSAWIYPDNISAGARGIIAKRAATEQTGAYHFGQNGDELNFRIYASDGASTTVTTTSSPLVASQWQHIVVTMDDVADDVYFYVDGVQVGSDTSTITVAFTDSSHPLLIGWSGQGSEYFNGRIRDVRFYDYNLSAEQVKSLYLGRYLPTPLHWWKINEGTGATATIEDYGTGTDADGTGVSLTWAGTDNFKVNGSARIGTNGSI